MRYKLPRTGKPSTALCLKIRVLKLKIEEADHLLNLALSGKHCYRFFTSIAYLNGTENEYN